MVRVGSLALLAALQFAPTLTTAFLVNLPRSFSRTRCPTAVLSLFEDEPELLEVTDNFLKAKYQQSLEGTDKETLTKDDVRDLLRSLLPPVTPEELDEEVQKTLELILANNTDKQNTDAISEKCFVKAFPQNSYWQEAGELVVKELMYFDALYSYYQTGESLLKNTDYEELKESLTWDGSSIASMTKDEALFVTAVASAKRGDPIMDDNEYGSLKKQLQDRRSWVTARSPDALEKLGLDTFLGYLHRALK